MSTSGTTRHLGARTGVTPLAWLCLVAAAILMLFATLASGGVSIGDVSMWTWFFAALTAVLASVIAP
jgi:hypothetical protein